MTQFDEAARRAVLSTVNLMQSYTDEIIQIDEARFGELKVEVAKHFAEIEAVFQKLAFLVDHAYYPTIANCSEMTVAEYLSDPQVKAAIERSKE